MRRRNIKWPVGNETTLPRVNIEVNWKITNLLSHFEGTGHNFH